MRVSQRFRTECPVGLWTTRGQGQGHPCSMTLTFTRPIFSGRGRVHSVLTTQPDSPCYKKIAHLSFSRTFENTDRRTCCTVNFVHNIFKKNVWNMTISRLVYQLHTSSSSLHSNSYWVADNAASTERKCAQVESHISVILLCRRCVVDRCSHAV